MSNDDLESLPGVGPATADKLIEAGYESFQSIAAANPPELANKADIGDSTSEDVVRAARKQADIGGFESGADIFDERQNMGRISLGADALDELFGGEGLETGAMTEFYGEFSAGKSQITHQLCVNAQLDEDDGGTHSSVVFLDTEDTFRPERIADMVRGLEDDILERVLDREGIEGTPNSESAMEELIQVFLDRIFVAKAFNSNHQILLAEKAKEIVQEQSDTEFPVGLLCVDSLLAHLRSEYVGRGELAKRQQKLNKHITDLKSIMDLTDAAVVVTNQVASNPDSYFGDPTQPIGGNILGHASTHRIYIRKSKGDKRIFRLIDSPDNADAEAPAEIVEAGIVDS